MKNVFKKILLLVTFIFVCSAFTFNVTILKAETTTTDDNAYNYTTLNETTRDLAPGVQQIINEGYTTRKSTKYDQRVNVFTADLSQNKDIKIATWAIPDGSNTGFVRKDLLTIAKDYEAHNPGWVVLAGVNADQYFATIGTSIQTNGSYLYVPQPYYPMFTNGDNLFTVSALGEATMSAVVGFKNDGSKTPFVNGPRSLRGFFIHVYDDNMNEVGVYPADGLNCDLGSNGTVILSSYNTIEKTPATITRKGDNDIYFIGDADMAYVSNTTEWKSINGNATDAFFGKGKITQVTKSVTLNAGNKFAIETTNAELKAKLKVGTYVKAQLEFDEGFAGIQEATGYHTVQRKDGKDCNVANSYNTRAYPRSCFGCDADGKIYLMTCFGDNASPLAGLYAEEFNAFMKHYNITDAYQQDGGGSVTSVVRNERGVLDYAEACIEASHKNQGSLTYEEYRYILSGLFIVKKVPEINVEVKERNATSVKLNVDVSHIKDFEAAEVRFKNLENGVCSSFPLDLTKDINEIEAKGLSSYTNYMYEVFVQSPGYDMETTYVSAALQTLKIAPVIQNMKLTKDGENSILTFNYIDNDKAIVNLTVNVGKSKYYCELKAGVATVKLDGMVSIDDLKITADCTIDPKSTDRSQISLHFYGLVSDVEYIFNAPKVAVEKWMDSFCN